MRMACCLQSTCTCTCCSRNYRSCCYYRFCLCCCSCNSVPVFTRKVSARATEKWKCNALFHMAAKFHTSPQGRSKCVLHTLTHTHTHACTYTFCLGELIWFLVLGTLSMLGRHDQQQRSALTAARLGGHFSFRNRYRYTTIEYQIG